MERPEGEERDGLAMTADAPAAEEGLDDGAFLNFADTYLLNDAPLTEDMQVISGALGDPEAKIIHGDETHKDAGGRMRHSALQLDWEGSSPALRNSSEPSWNAHGKRSGPEIMDTLATEKGRAETGDSSEWEQTREQLGSIPMMKHTDSPESVLMGAGQPSEERPQSMGLSCGDAGFGHADPFSRGARMGSASSYQGNAADVMQMPASQPIQQPFGRVSDFTALEHDHLDSMGAADPWDRRGGSAGAGIPGAAFEMDYRQSRPASRAFWGDTPGDMPGSLDDLGPMRMPTGIRSEASIYRMHSDMSGAPLRERYHPPRRQLSADFSYDLQRAAGMEGMGGLAGSASLDQVFDPHMQHNSMPQMDAFGRGGVRMVGGALPMRAPSPRGPQQPYYSPQTPVPMQDPPMLDSSRKRMREAYYPTSKASLAQQERGMGMRTSPRQMRGSKVLQEEQLIETLKRQISALDPQTKSTLKESLYRISRNTNARVSGMGEPARLNSRNSFVDRVVANLMYNRFESGAALSSSPAMRLPGGMGAPYGSQGRLSSSPNMPMDKPSLRLENSPNA